MLARSLIAVSSLALLALAPQGQKVRIFVGTYEPPGQYLEPAAQDRAESAKHVEMSLKMIRGGKKLLEFVKERAKADVVVEVAGRATGQSGGQVTSVVPLGFGGFIASSHPTAACYVFAWLRAGEFERRVAGSSMSWGYAGNDLAHQVLDWVQANQKAILENRK